MKIAGAVLVMAVCLGAAALCGRAAVVGSEEKEEGPVLKVEREVGTEIKWKVVTEEKAVVTKTKGEKKTVSEWDCTATDEVGVIFGNETKSGWETTWAYKGTARNLKNYTTDGEDEKVSKAVEFEWPRLPEMRTVLTDRFGRAMPPGEKAPGHEAWENYVIDSLRTIPDEGLKDGQELTGDITIGEEKYGTYTLKCELKEAVDGKSPRQWLLTGKVSAEREGGKVTIDDYSAGWIEGKGMPASESCTVRIERLTKTDAGETKTEITRKVNRELVDFAILEKDALNSAASLFGLTEKAFEAISKCDLTRKNLNKTPEKLKVAAVEAFWKAVKAAPRHGVVSDALYAWYFNASVYMMPKVGAPAKPVAPEGWINTRGIDYRDLEGKVIIIEFWSMGCPPCKAIAPHLDQLYRKYKNKGLEIIAITGSSARVQTFVNDKKLTYPIATSDTRGYIFDQNGRPWLKGGKPCRYPLTGISYQGTFRGIPHAFLVDRKGILRLHDHPGKIDAMLKKLLREE